MLESRDLPRNKLSDFLEDRVVMSLEWERSERARKVSGIMRIRQFAGMFCFGELVIV